MRRSISHAARDLKVLGRLAIVPGLIASVIALLVLIFAFLSSTNSRPVAPWFGTAVWTGTVAAIALGWFASRVRSGSTLTIGSAALTFSLGVLLLVVWRSRAGEPAILVVLTAFVPTILAASSWWALHIARRLHSRFPDCLSRPHATRRLSLPRDARALRAVGAALLGGLQVLVALAAVMALAPLLRGGAVSVSFKFFMPGAYRHFRRVRAVLALRAQEVRLDDRRLPVLLLRSFADDELAMRRTKAFLVNVTQTKLSLEEQIVAQLWEVGPVVAIGQPELETDPIGAAHERIVGPHPDVSASGQSIDISESGIGVYLPLRFTPGRVVEVKINDSEMFGVVTFSTPERSFFRTGIEVWQVLIGRSELAELLKLTLQETMPNQKLEYSQPAQ